jgi:hypothetical protein
MIRFPLTGFLMFYLHANDSATGLANRAAVLLVKFRSLSSQTRIIQNSFAQASNTALIRIQRRT